MVDPSWRWLWAFLWTTMVIVPAALATIFVLSFEKPVSEGSSDCPDPPMGMVAEIEVTIDNTGLATPRAITSMNVSIPENSEIASHLVRSRDEATYKLAMSCVLGVVEGRRYERRREPPSVTKEADLVVVRDTTTSDPVKTVTDWGTRVGTLILFTPAPGRWQAEITRPEFLARAQWRKVSVTAPPGWLTRPEPYSTAEVRAERIQWMSSAPDPQGNGTLARFTIHPDARTQMALTAGTRGWHWATILLYGLNTIVLVGLLVLWAHRCGAMRVVRLCLPILVVAAALTAGWIAYGYGWDGRYTDIWATVLILGAALAWGMPWPIVGAVALEALLAGGIAYQADELAVRGFFGAHAAALGVVAAQTVVAFHLSVLLAAGLINAARVLMTGARQLRPPPEVWWSGAFIAAALVVERFAGVRAVLAQHMWAERQPLSPPYVEWTTAYYPTRILQNVGSLLPVLAVIGAWALIRVRLDDRFAVLLFIMGPVSWMALPFGLWLPVWPLAWFILALWLRHSHPLLEKQLPRSGQTVRSVADAYDIGELRGAAARWSRIQHRGRALDRDLAKGTIQVGAHADETSRLAGTSLLPDAKVQTIDWLRAASVTPVDVVLALGPKATPWENAKRGAVVAAAVGAPAAVLKLWLGRQTQPAAQPGPDYSVMLDWITLIAWEAAAWMGAGAVLGLLWQKLPFRRGILRTLPLITAVAAVEILRYAMVELTGGNSLAMVDLALFAAVITATALVMDLEALRPTDTWWSRRRDALAAAYGMENLGARIAFVVAQAAVIVTIFANLDAVIGERPSDWTPPPPGSGQYSGGAR